MNKLNVIGPVCHQTSYGESVISIVTELTKLGKEVSLFPIGPVSIDPGLQDTHEPIKKSLCDGQRGYYDQKSISLRIFHANSMAEHVGSPRVGFTIFELDKFSILETNHLKQLDHIIVNSEWAKSIVDKQIGVPCSIVPLGVDTTLFKPVERTNKPTRFVLCGKIETRKRTKEIVDAFNLAFYKEDDVELYLAWSNIFMDKTELDEWIRFAKSKKLGSKTFPLERFQSSVQVANLLSSCDCLVSCSSAEGWNLPCLQMLSTGGHVIATRNTAQTEFLNDKNSLLIDTSELEIARDAKWFSSQGFEGTPGQWYKIGKPQIDQLVTHLRMVHEFKQTGSLKMNSEGIETAKSFTWTNSAKKLTEVLEQL